MGKPEQVPRVVAGAVASPRPRQRYLVGLDAQAIALYSRLVPGEVRDRLARLGLGL